MKLLFLDTETAGLDPKKNPAIQLSGILEIDGKILEEFNYHIRPDMNASNNLIDDKALEINKISREKLLDPDRIDPSTVYKKLKSKFLTHIDRYDKSDKLYMVGQNVQFDYGFLLELWKSQGDDYLGSFIHHNKIDLIALTASMRLAGKITIPNMKLATLCEYFGLPEQSHDALDDIRRTREVFTRMVSAIQKSDLSLSAPAPNDSGDESLQSL